LWSTKDSMCRFSRAHDYNEQKTLYRGLVGTYNCVNKRLHVEV